MGNFLKNLFATKAPITPTKVLMLGLDSAGKTTTLYALKLGEVISTIPTIGFNVEQLKYKTITFLVWDVGGQQKLRNLWTHYFEHARALIYIVDSSDSERIDLAAQQLNRVLSHPDMAKAALLVLANKRDIATMNLQTLTQRLGVRKMQRNWAVYPVTAIRPLQQSGLGEAMEWLISNIADPIVPKVKINVG